MRSAAKLIMIGLACIALAVIAGCKSDPVKPTNYDTYIQLTKDANAAADVERQNRMAAFAALGQKCTGDNCVAMVALTMALEGKGSNVGPQIAPPPPEQPSLGREMFLTLLNGNLIGTAVNGAVAWHSSDNQRKTQIGEYNFLSSAIGDMKASNTYNGGYIGGNVAGPGAGIGNTFNRNTSVSGTGNGVNGSNVDNSHDNRNASNGPFDNSGNGGNCSSGGTAGDAGSGAGGTCPGG